MISLKRYFSIVAFDKKDYMELRPSIRSSNFKALRTVSFLVTALFALLTINSFIFQTNASKINQQLYIIYTAASFVIYLLSALVVRKYPWAVAILVHMFMALVHYFGIRVGTINQPLHPAVTYIVLIFVFPIMFIDRPWRTAFFNLCSGLLFLYLSYKFKTFELFVLDFTNVLSFYVLGLIIGRYFTAVKIKQLKLLKIIENERDTDNFTGVLTKTAFLREMERLLSIDSSRGVFLMIDVDNFKSFNDTYGHDFGDKVLSKIGECMNNSFRQSDLLGRFGGDEFFVFIPSTNETDIALVRAKSLQYQLAEEIQIPGEPDMKVTLSIGISNCSGFGETYQSLFKKADEAIYEAKASGKDTIIVK